MRLFNPQSAKEITYAAPLTPNTVERLEKGIRHMRVARNVSFQVKTGKMTEFNRIFETEVLPMLRKQKGFKHELALVDKDRVVGFSLWEDRACADAYNRDVYPQIVQKLTPLTDGTPRVETFEVSITTLPA
jgi:quinol monooxygenase YgiN